jgi:Fur family ferric uptake transcriptional regulator
MSRVRQHSPRRNTRQRRVIVEELMKSSSHPTASELYEATRRRLPRISLGTVYRNLNLLGRMGLVRKVEGPGGEARFDGNVEPHHHVRCIHCGGVADVVDLPAGPRGDELEDVGGYEILGYRLEFIGVCPECRTHSAAEEEASASAGGEQGQ